MHALEFQAVQVDLGNGSGFVAIAVHTEKMIVVRKILVSEIEHSFLLEGLNKGTAEIEQERALQIRLRRDGNTGGFLSALAAEFALVLALVQIAHVGGFGDTGEGPPHSVTGSELNAVHGNRQTGIGAEVGGDLLGAGLINADLTGAESGIGGRKGLAHLLPGHCFLSERAEWQGDGQQEADTETSESADPCCAHAKHN